MDEEDIFRMELLALCRKHGFVIGACGCCQSPWVVPLKDVAIYSHTIPSPDEMGIKPPDPPEFSMQG